MNAIDKIMKLHAATSIEKKDIALRDLLIRDGGKEKTVTVKIKGFASKYVPKYHNENNDGFHTMIYLDDEAKTKTGCFSNALHELANFFYQGGGVDISAPFKKINFTDDAYIEVKITHVDLDAKKSTYNFEIVGGNVEANKIEMMGQTAGSSPMLLTDGK